MNLSINNDLKENGIVYLKNLLNKEEVEYIKKRVIFYDNKLGSANTKVAPYRNSIGFSASQKSQIKKLLKLKFSLFLDSHFLLKLHKKKKLDKISDNYFSQKSFLNSVTGFYTPKGDEDILPWHCDQAYGKKGKSKDSKFYNPDHIGLKFMIYLTDVDSGNGCTSYIPKSHKITYALRKGIYRKKILYTPYWSLKELAETVTLNKNLDYFENYFKNTNLLQNFLNDVKFIENNNTKKYDFSLKAGDAILFDEGGIHKGSKTASSERAVIRYTFSTNDY